MNRSFPLLVGIVALMPIAVDAPPDSSDYGETRMHVGAGLGQYAFVVRDCDGNKVSELPVNAQDVGVAVDHRFARTPVSIGVNGGWTRDDPGTLWDRNADPSAPVSGFSPSTNSYINPHAALEWRRFGIGAGWIGHEHPLPFGTNDPGVAQDNPDDMSLHLRIGPRDGVHFRGSWMEGVPIYSDGGYLNFGMGFPVSGSQVFLGMTDGPMERVGASLQLDHPLTPTLSAGVRAQSNFDGAGNVGLALEYKIRH